MNCEKVNFLLDAKPAAELTHAERQAVDEHFASCAACREVWDAYGEIAALQIPPTPRDLRSRIAAALVARPVSSARGIRRSFVIGAVLVLGAAAATTVALRYDTRPEPASVVETDSPPPVTTPTLASSEPAPASEPNSAEATAAERSQPNDAASSLAFPLDRQSVVVIAVPDPAADSAMAAALATCHDVVVEHMRAVDGLNIIAEDRLAPFAGSALSETEIARQLGAATVLVLRSAERQPSCNATLFEVEGAARRAGLLVFLDPSWTQERWQQFGVNITRSVRDALLNDPSSLRAQAQADVLNTTLGDRERLTALFKLRRTGPGSLFADPSFDESVIAAVIQIGMTSRDAEDRAYAWTLLHFVEDSAVLQPLLYALANDPSDRVRGAAARALSTHVDEPGVADALRRTAAEDPNDQPEVACCLPTVRESARLALRGGMTHHDAVRSAVLDESLSPHERLLLLSPQDLIMRLDAFEPDVARAVFALGVAADDPGLRARAWGLLEAVREPDFKAPLLEDLARHPAENVRTAAARGLIQLRDEPDVRAALEQALNDSSAGVQRAARASLDGVGFGVGR